MSVQEKFDVKTTVSSEERQLVEIDPKEERGLVWRLDVFFLVIGFLSYTFKYLDQTNISNAYVSGMQDDLNIVGNEYNWFTTYFNIGYMIMLYPSCIIISHVGPSVWLPACELLWGILTCCLSTATSYKTVYGLRFLIGFCEGATWPGYFTLISQWYQPHEMALRMTCFNMAQAVGGMMSGAMQGGLTTHLDGALGRSGWQWAFIINGICTIVIALAAFVLLPGYPERPNPLAKWYLTPRNIEIALARAKQVGRKPQIGITVQNFVRAFGFWQLWLVSITWCIAGNTTPSGYFNLWLKSLTNPDGTKKYSTASLNYLPIAGQALQLVSQLIISGLSDYFRVRLPFLFVHAAINITSLIILIVRPASESSYMAGWYLNYVGAVSTILLCSWAAAHLEHEPQVRTCLFATGTLFSYLLSAFVPLAAYPASQAPNWRIGAKLYLGFACVALSLYVVIHFTFKYEEKRRSKYAADLEQRRNSAEETAGYLPTKI